MNDYPSNVKQKLKGIWFSFSSAFPVLPGKPPKFQYLGLFFCKLQSIFLEPLFQSLAKHFRFPLILKTADKIICAMPKSA